MCTQEFRNLQLGLRAFLVAALLTGNMGQALAQSPAASSGGPKEGIQVHGDWVIEVRNPDGGLADRREFKNALHAQGGTALAQLLGRQRSTGFWIVAVDSVGELTPCLGSLAGCGIYESLAGQFLPNLAGASGNLQVTIPPVPSGLPNQLQLTGSVTATAASSISSVLTAIANCPAGVGPATPCLIVQSETLIFSVTSPSAFVPIPVVVGQIIQVTVTFSFS